MKGIFVFALIIAGAFAAAVTKTDPNTGRVWTYDVTASKCTLVSDATTPSTLTTAGSATNPCVNSAMVIDGTNIYLVGTTQEQYTATGNSGFSATNTIPSAAAHVFIIKVDITNAANPQVTKWSWLPILDNANAYKAATAPSVWVCGTDKVAVQVTGTVTTDKLLGSGSVYAAAPPTAGAVSPLDAAFKGVYILSQTDLAITGGVGTATTGNAQCAADISTVNDAAATPVAWTLGHTQVSADQINCWIRKGTAAAGTYTEIAATAAKTCRAVKVLADGNNLYGVLNSDATLTAANLDGTPSTGAPFPTSTLYTALLIRVDAAAAATKVNKLSYYQGQDNAATPAFVGITATDAAWCLTHIRIAGKVAATTSKFPGAAATATTFVAGATGATTGHIAVDKTSFAVLNSGSGATLPAACSADIKKVSDTSVTPAVEWTVGHTQSDTTTIKCWVKRGTTEVMIESAANKKCNAVGIVLDKNVPFIAVNTDGAVDAAALNAGALTGAIFETIPAGVTGQTGFVAKLAADTGKVVDATYLAGKSATAFVAAPITAFDACGTQLKVTVNVGANNNAPGKAATSAAWVAGQATTGILGIDKTALTISESVASTANLAACGTAGGDDSGDGDDEESAGVLAIANVALAFLGLAYMF